MAAQSTLAAPDTTPCLSLLCVATGPSAGMEKHQGTYLSLSHMDICKAPAGVSPPWHCCAHNCPLTLGCAEPARGAGHPNLPEPGLPARARAVGCSPWQGGWCQNLAMLQH